MKLIIVTIILFGLFGCVPSQRGVEKPKQIPLKIDSLASDSLTSEIQDTIVVLYEPIDPYSKVSAKFLDENYRNYLREVKLLKSKQGDLYDILLQTFPYWYGTTWEYNGYTHKPRQGEVACGYFVSTVLRDIGFKVNRYDLAKKFSHDIVTIMTSDTLDFYDFDSMKDSLTNRKDDIYICGLDNHVGFLVQKNDSLFFTHSNYMGPVAVTTELAEQSEALLSSNRFVLGGLTKDEDVLAKWIRSTPIIIE